MKLIISAIVLMFAMSAFGQTVDELQSKAKKLKVNKDLQIHYDKFRDRSRIGTKYDTLTSSSILSVAVGRLDVTVGAMVAFVDGNGIAEGKTIDTFYFDIGAGSSYKVPDGEATVYFVVDGERIVIEPSKDDLSFGGSLNQRYAMYQLTRDQLTQIANAKEAEAMIHSLPIKIKDKFQRRMKSLLTLTAGDQ